MKEGEEFSGSKLEARILRLCVKRGTETTTIFSVAALMTA